MNTKYSSSYFIPILIILFGIVLRLFFLDSQGFWNDEGATLTNSIGSTLQNNISAVLNLDHADRFQPLYFILLFLWRQIFDNTEVSIRMLSVILGVGSAFFVFLIALKIYGKTHAFWSSLLISTSSFAIYYSQNARPPILLMFLASAQLYFSISLFNEAIGFKKIEKWLFVASTAMATLSSVISIPFTIALSISHFIFGKKVKQWFTWWVLATLFSLPAVYIYFSSPHSADPSSIPVTRQNTSLIQNLVFICYGLLVGETYGPSTSQLKSGNAINTLISYLPQLFLFFIVVAVIFITLISVLSSKYNPDKYKHYDRFFVTILIISSVLLIIFSRVTEINLLPRHCSYLYLPLALLIPSCFRVENIVKTETQKHGFYKLIPKKVSHFTKISIIFLIIMNVYSLGNHYFNKNYWRDDYRSVASFITQNTNNTTASILLVGKYNLLRYYNDENTLYSPGLVNQLNSGKFAQKVKELTGDSEQVFLIVGRKFDLAPKEVLKKEMSEFYSLYSQVDFPYIKIYCFSKN